VTKGHDTPRTAAPDGTLRLSGVGVAGLSGRHDIVVKDGFVADVVPANPGDAGKACGGFVTPLLADVHVHLDKTHTIQRIKAGNPAPIQSLFDAGRTGPPPISVRGQAPRWKQPSRMASVPCAAMSTG
jgi:cytosine deaminase